MSKPGVITLSGEAKNFVLSNFPAFKDSLKIIFPLVLIVAFAKHISAAFELAWVQPLTGLAMLFLYACFCLSWHRVSLQGTETNHVINPLKLQKDEWKFIGLFVLLTSVLSLFVFLVSYLTEQMSAPYGKGIALLTSLISLVIVAFGMCAYFRFAFILPARSVGVSLSQVDAARASKGLTVPLLGSTTIFGVLFIIVLFVYLLVVGMIAEVAGGDAQMEPLKVALVAFFLSIPIYAGIFFLLALYTTALSRAYQWGIQNNA